MVEDLKKRVEAILFSAGRRMEFEEIRRLCRAKEDELKAILQELKQEYEAKDSSIMLVEEGNFWKLTIKEKYLNIVRRIVTQTELSKSIMETLAVIAWKYPVLQADVIKIRTNKAYDHLNELEELGYISRQKYGRTKLIKLTQKFFDYFDLPEDKLKEVFKDFTQLAQAIEQQEEELEKKKEEFEKAKEEAQKEPGQEQQQEVITPEQKQETSQEQSTEPKTEIIEQPEIDLLDKEGHKQKLEVFEEPESAQIEVAEEKLGPLEIVDEPEEQIEKPVQKIEFPKEDMLSEEEIEEPAVEQKAEQIIKGITAHKKKEPKSEVTEEEPKKKQPKESEEEKEVDKIVEQMIHPPKKKDENSYDDADEETKDNDSKEEKEKQDSGEL